jgi:hypothetical protein
MTTLDLVSKTCAICGHEDTYTVIMSTNSFGSPDLDLRPPEMQRSTMEYWVESCSECGYRSHDVSELIEGAEDIVRSEAYRQQLEDSTFPPLANSFLCHAMIQENIRDFSGAGQATIQAAWACDDGGMAAEGRECRERAISLLRKARANDQVDEEPPGAAEALLVDLLRRSEQFEEAAETCNAGLLKSMDPVISDVLRFQRSLIDAKDVGSYTIEEALQAESEN